MVFLVSLISSASSGLTWVFYEYRHHKKLSGLDFCCGAIAGLAAVTPGSGFVAPWAAIIIGCTNGILANVGCKLKHYIGIDDALDTFGVHGIGGFYGNIVAGIFAQKWIAELDGMKIAGGWVEGNWMQVPYQLAGSFAGAGWSFGWTFLIVIIMQKIPKLRLRLDPDEELLGDMAEMGEGAPYSYPAPKTEIDHVAIIKMNGEMPMSNGGSIHKESFEKPTTANSLKKAAMDIKSLYNKSFRRPSSTSSLVRLNSTNNIKSLGPVENAKIENTHTMNNEDLFDKYENQNVAKLSIYRPSTGNDFKEISFDKPSVENSMPMQLFDENKF